MTRGRRRRCFGEPKRVAARPRGLRGDAAHGDDEAVTEWITTGSVVGSPSWSIRSTTSIPSGSQFFVVTGDDVGLPPEYAVVGTVTEGMDVVERIDQLGDPTTEQPLQPVVIHSVTASSSP